MVLGELVGVVAEPLVGRDQLEALVQLPCRRQAGRVVMVEDGEEHRRSLSVPGDSHGARGRSHAPVRDHRLSIHPASARWLDPTELRLESWRATGNSRWRASAAASAVAVACAFIAGCTGSGASASRGRARGHGQASGHRRAGQPGAASAPPARLPRRRAPAAPTTGSPAAACVTQVLGNLTLAQRVGELFLVGVDGNIAGPELTAAERTYHFGSLLLNKTGGGHRRARRADGRDAGARAR